MENKKWAPSQEENLGVITSVYEFIKEELSELQKETGCLLYTSPSPRD